MECIISHGICFSRYRSVSFTLCR